MRGMGGDRDGCVEEVKEWILQVRGYYATAETQVSC